MQVGSDASATTLDQGAIRAQLEAHLAQSGGSLSDVARAVGRSVSSLSTWMKGAYGGRSDLLAMELQKYLSLHQERAAVGQRRAPTGDAVAETSVYLRVHQVCFYAGLYRDLGLIVGPPGIGKTLALRRFAADHLALVHTVSVHEGHPKSVLIELAKLLGLDAGGRQTELVARIRKALKHTERLFIFDEAQHLQSDALEMLRQLRDECGFGMVWCGNPKVLSRLKAGQEAAFAQIWSRVGITADFTMLGEQELAEDVRALAEARGWTDPDVHTRLLRVAVRGGFLRSADKLLNLGSSLAGDGVTTAAHLAEASEMLGWGRWS